MSVSRFDEVVARFVRVAGSEAEKPLVVIPSRERDFPLFQLVLGPGNPRRVLISAGIHGDEPAGVETVLIALETGFFEPFLREWEITLLPCINPTGFGAGTRENHAQIDLNRKFKEPNPPEEVRAVQSVFERPFLLDLELHEDVDTPGYYLYQKEHGGISPLGRDILDAVAPIMPLNEAPEIEEMPADRGLLARLSEPEEMEWWPMAVYAYDQGCQAVFTLETSVQFAMGTRVKAHLKALETALSGFGEGRIRS